MVLTGKTFRSKVYGKEREVTPFIGVIEHDDDQLVRGIGVMCPNQDKLIFQGIDSEGPIHYALAFTMIYYLWELTDALIKDCITATNAGCRVKNFCQTIQRGEHRTNLLLEAQRKAYDTKISTDALMNITAGFAQHGAPFVSRIIAPISIASPRPLYLPLARAQKEALALSA